MLEWLICAASVATQAPDASLALQESSQADFFEFLADWDEKDAAALDADFVGDDDGAIVNSEKSKDGKGARWAPGREEDSR